MARGVPWRAPVGADGGTKDETTGIEAVVYEKGFDQALGGAASSSTRDHKPGLRNQLGASARCRFADERGLRSEASGQVAPSR